MGNAKTSLKSKKSTLTLLWIWNICLWPYHPECAQSCLKYLKAYKHLGIVFVFFNLRSEIICTIKELLMLCVVHLKDGINNPYLRVGSGGGQQGSSEYIYIYGTLKNSFKILRSRFILLKKASQEYIATRFQRQEIILLPKIGHIWHHRNTKKHLIKMGLYKKFPAVPWQVLRT